MRAVATLCLVAGAITMVYGGLISLVAWLAFLGTLPTAGTAAGSTALMQLVPYTFAVVLCLPLFALWGILEALADIRDRLASTALPIGARLVDPVQPRQERPVVAHVE